MSSDAVRAPVGPGRRWASRIVVGVVGLLLVVGGLWGAVPPVLVWTHLGGTAVQVRGTAPVHHPRSVSCVGWVLPSGVAPPVPLPGHRLSWALTTTAKERADGHRVTVQSGQCVDGDYWALAAGDDEVWSRTVDWSTLLDVGVRALWVPLGCGLLLGLRRGGRRTRDGSHAQSSEPDP